MLVVVEVTGMSLAMVTVLGAATIARHRAQAAADLAALAAVGAGPASACVEAGRVAGDNGARVEECAVGVDGRVRVRVSVDIPVIPGRERARGRAHAGPASVAGPQP
jgi:secretion/DNA translocation related TadE-like protein